MPITKKEMLLNKRDKVLQLCAEGLTQQEIASKLLVSQKTVSNDLTWLKEQAKERIRHHIEQTLPLEFQKSLTTLEQLKKRAWAILENADDNRTKLDAIHSDQMLKLTTTIGSITITTSNPAETVF